MLRIYPWILLLFFGFSTYAAPVGNPASPILMNCGLFTSSNPWLAFTSGYLADYISDKGYTLESGSAEFDPDQAFRRFGLQSQMASFSLTLCERMEIYSLLGGSKEHLKWHREIHPEDLYASFPDFETTHHFSWGLGSRVVLLHWGNLFFSADGSYFAVPSSPKAFFRFLNRLHLPLETEKQYFYMREWQIGAAFSCKFWLITPYAGAKYLRSQLMIQEGLHNSFLKYENSHRIGYYYGLTLNVFKFQVNIERRVRDEFAYSFSAQAIF